MMSNGSRPNQQNARPNAAKEEGARHPSSAASAAMTAGASLSPDTRSVTLGGDDRPMDEEAGLRGESGE